jgi:DNA (cytosine-5)-methyltransferase 1
MRALELYAGIGGFASAIRDSGVEVVAAIEQSDVALSVYRANFPHRTLEKNLNGITAKDLARFEADLWWMSPPCQSFTVRGAQRDVDDPRARSFLRLIGILRELRPPTIALENVPAFSGSRAHAALIEALLSSGYRIRERVLCPTELGVPNRRARYYLAASRGPLAERRSDSGRPLRPLAAFLDEAADRDESLRVPSEVAEKYRWAMQVVDRVDPKAISACFTSAYGRSWVRSGAYLRTERGPRCFSPREVLRLFGFPESFRIPPDLAQGRVWSLVGNSLSLFALKEILSIAIDGGRDHAL